MSRPVVTATRPQLALMSYLDALLQDAAAELADSVSLDEFETAVLEEQVRDARLHSVAVQVPEPLALVSRPESPVVTPPPVMPVQVDVLLVAPVEPAPALQPAVPSVLQPAGGPPSWAQEPFECLLFDVAGLTLAVPLVCLGTIYSLAGQELTPLFGQPDWFLGLLPTANGNLKVLDTARWVMPDRYRDEFRDGLQYVISVQGYEWGLAVHQVSRSIRLDPNAVKWRGQRTQRPWLAGTVIEHMCALLDVAVLAELIASGAAKRMVNGQLQ
ncbi:MAG: CheW domain-containing protein [Pseudomonas sp.]|nr:CheW domain-containing protein [Pseudomonas sp.]